VEVFGEEGAQFVAVLRPAAEEVFAGGHKFLVGFVYPSRFKIPVVTKYEMSYNLRHRNGKVFSWTIYD